ncbi:MAG: GAF and ANTAR domain-containing protein [Deltaproteobacteria bacterium]|nr:GAF and ANTAR domain-containing protein [Deltaproteobacteria bacterium]
MENKEIFSDSELVDEEKLLTALTRISEAITSDLYLDDILKFIVTITAELFGSKICSLMLLDESKNELLVKATQSISEEYNKKENIKVGTGISGKVAKTGQTISVLDVRESNQYYNKEIAKKEKLCSLLSVPLTVKGEVIGVLNCYTSRPHRFSKNEERVIQSIANQAAVVIENFRLVVESQVIKDELEARKTIETAKKILMEQEGLTEKDAYSRLRKFSMNTRKSMRVIAEAIVLTQQVKLSDLKPLFLQMK